MLSRLFTSPGTFAITFLLVCVTWVNAWPTTEPYWPHYPDRSLQILDGTWSFAYKDNFDLDKISPSAIDTNETVTVPNAFDVAPPGVMGRRGTAFYRTTFDLAPGKKGMIYFSACSFYCHAFIDGKSIGDHRAGGYQPFWFEIPPSSKKTREIFVAADNRFNKETAPTHTGGDFWEYGGITRNVIVHELPADTFILRVETFTASLSTINVNIVFSGAPISKAKISYRIDDNAASSTLSETVTNSTVKLSNLYIPNAKPWTMKTPNLHTMDVWLHDDSGQKVDHVVVRFGLRILGVDKETYRLTINDEIIKLHGYNRHTMYNDTGSALTLEQVHQDVALLRDLGANYVRGAHYPQDQRFLDLCDEYGIAIWEETLGPGVSTGDLLDPYFMKYQIQAVNEMIDASVNHPSVIFHAFYNEGPSNDPKACVGYKASSDAIKARVGSSRFVTWANNHLMADVCMEYEDVISFNNYPAWYNHFGDLNYTTTFWNEQAKEVHEKHPGKPFFISETGASGVWEYTNKTAVKWSQLYQNEVVSRDAAVALENDHISGITLWQFNDIKANDGDTKKCGECKYIPGTNDCAYIDVNCGRPGGENHKGTVDFWRRKKMVYATIKRMYNAKSQSAVDVN